MSLDSEVTCAGCFTVNTSRRQNVDASIVCMTVVLQEASCVVGKVDRVQGLDLEPVRMDLLAVVKHAV